MGICVSPTALPDIGHPHGNITMGLTISLGTGSSKPHQLAASAESELCLDIPLRTEILNYHLIHWGWLLAKRPQLRSAVLLQSAGEPGVPQPGNPPAKRQLRWARRCEMDGSDGTRRCQTPGMLPLHEQRRLRKELHPLQRPGWELTQGNLSVGEPEASLASLERRPLKLLCIIGH